MIRKIRHIFSGSLWGPVAAVVANLAVAYVVYFLCRLVFLAVNYSAFADGLSMGHLWEMLRGGFVFDSSAIMYTNVLWIVLMLLPWHGKETPLYHKVCRWIFVAVNGVAVVMNMCDCVYFQYTSRRTTSTVFSEFSNEGNLAGIFGTEILRHWYLVLIGAALIYGLWRLYRDYELKRASLCWWRYSLAMVASIVVMVPCILGGMRGGLSHSVRPITVSNANQYVNHPTEAAIVLNTPFSLLRTIGKNVFEVPKYFTDEKQMLALYSPVHQPAAGAKMQRKNVVVLIVESLGREYIGSLNRDLDGGRYKGYTPFVDSLLAKSLTFEYTFANGRKSIDAMPSTLSSIPMMVEPFFLTPASMNDLTGLAGMLHEKGYYSAFFHGADNGSMGFEAFARATGYDRYYGRTEYNADAAGAGDADYDGIWAIWDEPYLQHMVRQVNGFKQPFLATVFTASSHHPFKVPQQYEHVYKEEGEPIHKCIRYTDMALRRFFESASKQPWYGNTIFVLVADHTNQNTHPYYKTDQGIYSIPIAFYTPDGSLEPGLKQDVIAQQIDVLPTLMGMLGYDKPYVAFGCDLLRTPAQDTWAFNYNNGIYQYFKGPWMLQWDGKATKALYRFKTDPLLKQNLAGKVAEQPRLEAELKSLIQQYMHRMNTNQLILR
ncbi:MAG: sulfatase-like hydrolase/transferase [Bacteroidales bacterium]|nr:sulfatase-like hydrolase/transferase [Bacteroidales bacterium]